MSTEIIMTNKLVDFAHLESKDIRTPSMLNSPSKVFSVRLRGDTATKVMLLASARGLTPGGILNAMLDDYLNQNARIQFQESMLAFADHQALRDDRLGEMLGRFEQRLDGFETLLQQATGAAGSDDV
jgi:hypothetical protein